MNCLLLIQCLFLFRGRERPQTQQQLRGFRAARPGLCPGDVGQATAAATAGGSGICGQGDQQAHITQVHCYKILTLLFEVSEILLLTSALKTIMT